MGEGLEVVDDRRLGCLLIFTLGALLGGLLNHWQFGKGKIDWGTAGEWAAAILTVLLLVVAFLGWRSQSKQAQDAIAAANKANALTIDRWQADLAEREREQASKVGYYYLDVGGDVTGFISVRCTNDSPSMIYDVRGLYLIGGQQVRPQWRLIDQPALQDQAPGGGPRLRAGMHVTIHLLSPLPKQELWNTVLIPNAHAITFLDNAGRWWRKWSDGRLEPDESAKLVDTPAEPSTPIAREMAGLPPLED